MMRDCSSTLNVPPAGARRKLKLDGREKKVEFRRTLLNLQVCP